MRYFQAVSAAALALAALPASGAEDLEELRRQLQELKQTYQMQIQALEQRLEAAEKTAEQAQTSAARAVSQSTPAETSAAFNPDISVILQGRYADFQNNPEDYQLPGFQLGGEAGLGEKGLSISHSELIMSANVDDKFYGQLTLALADHEGSTEVELEEAFIQTLGLGNGLGLKAGRFFSAIGYLNARHPHSWDFADTPLVYRGLFGNQLYDDGVQLTWLAPTDLYVNLGGELLRGGRFPAGGGDGVGAYSLFAKVGGDAGLSNSWQFGVSHWAADVENRAGGHAHAEEEHAHAEEHEAGHEEEHEAEWLFAEPLGFSGDSRVSGVDFVWKWAPDGNPKNRNFKFQTEYFWRSEDGVLSALNGDELLSAAYTGKQRGFYVQGVYQFMPQWRAGLRYDRLFSDNHAEEESALDALGLHSEGHKPKRYSVMLDWSNSEFSRMRLQFNRDNSTPRGDNQLFLQYIHSIGAHGAHEF